MEVFEILGNYHFVCLPCRRSIKVWKNRHAHPIICMNCQAEMINVGKQFTTPRKNDNKQWKKLEWMILNGWRGYGWPTKPKMGLRETKNLIGEVNEAEAKLRNNQRELKALENSKKVARYNFAHSNTAQKWALKELRKQEEYQNAVMKDLGLE